MDTSNSICLVDFKLYFITHSSPIPPAMESSQPLSIESFSYSWLVPSFETLESSLDASDEAFFIEMDPKLTASKRFFRASPPSQDFNFDFPKSQTPLTLLHADELISNGFIMPVFAKPLKTEEEDFAAPVSPRQREDVDSGRKMRCSSLKRCRRLSKRMLEKYMEFVKPLCRRFSGGRRANSRVEAADGVLYSTATSPRTSAVDNWRRSCDSESSIYEAVMHCKKSIGK